MDLSGIFSKRFITSPPAARALPRKKYEPNVEKVRRGIDGCFPFQCRLGNKSEIGRRKGQSIAQQAVRNEKFLLISSIDGNSEPETGSLANASYENNQPRNFLYKISMCLVVFFSERPPMKKSPVVQILRAAKAKKNA